jgi:hypothetical protein
VEMMLSWVSPHKVECRYLSSSFHISQFPWIISILLPQVVHAREHRQRKSLDHPCQRYWENCCLVLSEERRVIHFWMIILFKWRQSFPGFLP